MDDEVIPVETENPPKERVKLTHSTWAKVGAIVLLYVSLIFVIACVICFILSAMGGASDYQGVLDSIDRGLKGWEIVYGLAKFASGLYAVSVLVGIVFWRWRWPAWFSCFARRDTERARQSPG